METPLPHRYTEKQFRRFEEYINHAVEAWPKVVKCEPKLFDMAELTFVGRFRDAITSYHTHNWPSKINRIKFQSIYRDLVVSHRKDGIILVGSRDEVKDWERKVSPVPLPEPISSVDFTPPTEQIILDLNPPTLPPCKAFLMMLSHRRLLAPRITLLGLTPNEVAQFQLAFDISLDANPDGSYTLI